MKIKFLKEDNTSDTNEATLYVTGSSEKSLFLYHTNSDDGHYCYHFRVEGTKEEIKIIKEFCEEINKAE
jgi:hypothetical protein